MTPLVILDEGTVDHEAYISRVLPVALKYGRSALVENWTFQKDGAKPHTHAMTQQWCRDHFPAFIDKDHWPANSPDLNPLDYSIWDEFINVINWNEVTSKSTLVDELKIAHKRIRQSVVFESCSSWTNRLYRMYQADGAFLR